MTLINVVHNVKFDEPQYLNRSNRLFLMWKDIV